MKMICEKRLVIVIVMMMSRMGKLMKIILTLRALRKRRGRDELLNGTYPRLSDVVRRSRSRRVL